VINVQFRFADRSNSSVYTQKLVASFGRVSYEINRSNIFIKSFLVRSLSMRCATVFLVHTISLLESGDGHSPVPAGDVIYGVISSRVKRLD
jgi:hypothetical protein